MSTSMTSVTIAARDLAAFFGAVLPHVDRGATLPILKCLHLASHGGYLIAAATDRYTLGICRVACDAPDGISANLPAKAARQIPGWFKPSRGEHPDLTLSFDQDTLTVAAVGLAGIPAVQASWTLRPGDFPRPGVVIPREQVTPADDDFAPGFAVNPDYLARFATACPRGEPMRVTVPAAPGKSVVVRIGDHFVGAVAPVKVQPEQQPWLADGWADIFDSPGFTAPAATEKPARKPARKGRKP